MTDKTLKTCPCCGGAAQVMEVRGVMATGYRIQCESCGLQTPTEYYGTLTLSVEDPTTYIIYSAEAVLEKVIGLWNRRETRNDE